MSTKVTLVFWDPEGRSEETWDKVAVALEERHRVAIVDVTVEEVEDR
jgi:hypothetical protein